MVPAKLPILRSESQAHLLGLLLLAPTTWRTAGEVEEATGLPPASVHRELRRAVASGIVSRDDTVRPHRYSAAVDSPLFEPLATLLDRTVGVEVRLRSELEQTDGVRAAAIHGSWATQRVRPTSDVDLLVIGTPDGGALRRRLRVLGGEIGRRIDLTLLSEGELHSRLNDGEVFLQRLLAGPMIPLVGEVAGASHD